MPICIECRHPVRTLWTQYSGAGDPSSGHNIRLTVCKNCGRFCDKYVEHDFVVLFIDLVLIKPQVYRHLLHNTLMARDRDRFDPSIVRLGTLLLLFDVYLTWARIEKQNTAPMVPDFEDGDGGGGGAGGRPGGGSNLGSLAQQPIVLQYLFFCEYSRCCDSSEAFLSPLGPIPCERKGYTFRIWLWERIKQSSQKYTLFPISTGALILAASPCRVSNLRSSNPLHLLDAGLPRLHPVPHVVSLVAAQPHRPAQDIFAAKLGVHGVTCQLVHQAVPHPHGHLGL